MPISILNIAILGIALLAFVVVAVRFLTTASLAKLKRDQKVLSERAGQLQIRYKDIQKRRRSSQNTYTFFMKRKGELGLQLEERKKEIKKLAKELGEEGEFDDLIEDGGGSTEDSGPSLDVTSSPGATIDFLQFVAVVPEDLEDLNCTELTDTIGSEMERQGFKVRDRDWLSQALTGKHLALDELNSSREFARIAKETEISRIVVVQGTLGVSEVSSLQVQIIDSDSESEIFKVCYKAGDPEEKSSQVADKVVQAMLEICE
jgi:hypothetical protein